MEVRDSRTGCSGSSMSSTIISGFSPTPTAMLFSARIHEMGAGSGVEETRPNSTVNPSNGSVSDLISAASEMPSPSESALTGLVPTIAFGLIFLVAMFKWPRLWIASFFLGLPFFLSDTGKGLSASELGLGGFFLLSIVVWMVWSVGRPDIRLVRWWGDFLLLLFLLLSVGNLAISMLNGINALDWAAEWSIYLLVLFYFPIRHYFERDERSIRHLLLLGAASTVLMAAYSIYLYKARMSAGGALFAYQLWASRSVLLGPIFVMAMLVGIATLFNLHGRAKFFAFVIVLINAGALAVGIKSGQIADRRI